MEVLLLTGSQKMPNLIYTGLSAAQGSEPSEYSYLKVKQLNPKIQVLLFL